MNEARKGFKARHKNKVASIEPTKPRNFVAKNAINTGAGAHKDKKKAMKQGDTKHKKLDYAENLELQLNQKLQENKLDEFFWPVLGAVTGRVAAGVVGAGRAAATAASLAGRAVGSTVGNALDNDEETDEDVDSPEYNDEAGMSYGSLHTIARAADGLLDTIKEGDNLPEWCQEKISLAEDYLITVWDYLQSEKEQGVAEGSLELNTPDPVVVIQDLKGNMLDKLNLSVASQKYKLGNPQNIKNQLAHQNYTTVGSYVIVSPMGGQPQDKTTQGVAEGVTEGVNDPHIFKCIFLFGPMGAGKSTVARPLLSHTGLRSVNLDNFNELFVKKGQVPTGHLSPDQLEKSWQLTQTQQKSFIDSRLGVIIDGSGRNPDTAIGVIEKLMPLGYEFMMIFVNVSEATSIARQQSRAEKQKQQWGAGRQVDPTLAKNTYAQVQKMLGKYSAYFGPQKFVYVDNENTPDLEPAEKKVDAFLRAPITQPEAIEWIQSQKGGQQVAQKQQQLAKAQKSRDQALTQFKKSPLNPKFAKQGVAEGGYTHGFADPNAPSLGRRGREEDEYHVPDPVAPEYNIKVNGEVINRQPFANRAEALAWAKRAVAAGKLDPKTAKLSPINYVSEFATSGSDEGPGDDPYKYPKPRHYKRSIDYFGQFEADHFDHEDFNDATGTFKGYWGNDQIAYFKFDNPQRSGSEDPGMGWYYEPQNEGVREGSQKINWVKPNFNFEWHEVEEQSRMKQVPDDVRQYYQKHFPNKDAWLKAVQNGKAVVVPPDHAYEIRNAPFDKASLQKVLAPTGHEGPIGPAKEKRVNDLFDKGQVEMPIILKTSQGLWLIGGKTRLGTANYVKGLPAKVWLISGEQGVEEDWSQKYKSSINCSHPKGFSQKAHCAGKKKHNEDMSMEAVCPDCGMCEAHGNSKIYDKCWTGYKKVPGKKRGEEGSCKKIGESVAEKLNLKTMDTGAVIKDFEKSNAPQFRGKTKEKRKQMAIAAKMGAMKKKKKIGESLEEWTTDSLASHLFEQELTYEDRLNNMLSKKLSK